MKRKLDENDVPNEDPCSDEEMEDVEATEDVPAIEETEATHEQPSNSEPSFADFDLDPRLLQALAKLKWNKPTLVQQKAIPLAFDSKDVLAKAKTGSGKTAAYVLPVLQSILQRKRTSTDKYVSVLVLVPTRELAHQVTKVFGQLSSFCANQVRAVNLADKPSDAVQRALLSGAPDIVVSTPAKALSNIEAATLPTENLTHLVLDEADLVMSYGYEEDLHKIARVIPPGTQKMLSSATLSSEVDSLKGLFCRSPVLLDLKESEEDGEGVAQYYTQCAEEEKFILAYIIMKLGLIKGKCIIFVSNVDRCYQLKLFLEQFAIRSCILNSELPVNSRVHVVEEFNRNVYNIIIASDENEVIGGGGEADVGPVPGQDADEEAGQDGGAGEGEDEDKKAAATKLKSRGGRRPKKKRKMIKRDTQYGVSRGIDFKNVAYVFNFDLPTSSKSYTHRIGRTARAGKNGMALSFVIPEEQYRKHVPTSTETAEKDERVLAKIIKHQTKKGKEVKPYTFDMAQVNNFRYRANDALKSVTRGAIREARTRELRQELLKSERLKRHFEENPSELHHLRHDGELRAAKTHGHLRHVPEYLLPKDGQRPKEEVGFVPLHKQDDGKNRKFKRGKGGGKGRRVDPLKSFRTHRRGKKA